MLERCLRSLARQTRAADEIVVVDNASSDETAHVARKHGATVIYEPRPGITAAASRGYDAASADIIARCDADSVPAPDWIATIERRFREHPDVVAATGSATFYDLSPLANWLARVFYLRAYFFWAGAAVANTPVFGSNFAMRASVWRDVSASVPRDNPDLHDDFDLSFRFSPRDHVLFDPAMRVEISGRPFTDARAFGRRIGRALATLREHFPRQLPPRRWWHRLARPK